ncbi:MAG: TIGR00289 family protein, partial [Nanoarchaeota archaeon]
DIEKLKKLHGLNIAGEGGEFESLVVDCPLFTKRIVIEDVEIQEDARHTARLIIKKARLEEKR